MFRFKALLILILALFAPCVCAGQEREKTLAAKVFKNAKDETLLYRLFVPKDYIVGKRSIRSSFTFMAVVGAAATT